MMISTMVGPRGHDKTDERQMKVNAANGYNTSNSGILASVDILFDFAMVAPVGI
jgi:hypothetical protein